MLHQGLAPSRVHNTHGPAHSGACCTRSCTHQHARCTEKLQARMHNAPPAPTGQDTTWGCRAEQQQWGCSSRDGAVPGASSCSQHGAGCGDPGPRRGGFGFHCGPPALHSCFPKGLLAARGREPPSLCSCPIADVSPRLLAQGQSREQMEVPFPSSHHHQLPHFSAPQLPRAASPDSSHNRGRCWGKAQR